MGTITGYRHHLFVSFSGEVGREGNIQNPVVVGHILDFPDLVGNIGLDIDLTNGGVVGASDYIVPTVLIGSIY